VEPREPTMKQLNPLGSAGSWELAVVLGLATWSYVLLSTLVSQKDVTDHGLMALAVTLLSAAIIGNMIKSSPRSGEYLRINYVIVVGLALTAALLQGLTSHGGVASIATDWGPLALAGILAAASSFRPRIDQLWAGGIATVVIGLQKVLEGMAEQPPFGVTYFVVTAVAPVVIVTIGQSAYTGFAIRSLMAWRQGFSQTQADVTSFVGLGAARKIGQDFMSEFSVQVQPLLSRVLRNGRIGLADSQVASVAAERIRSRLVALSQETWVERLDVAVTDPDRLAEHLDVPARAAVRALLGGLAQHSVTDVTLALANNDAQDGVSVTITGHTVQPRFLLRTQLAPIFRVMYVVFYNVHVAYGPTSLTLQFDYGVERSGE
jgi:hypothetical protein